MSDSSILDLRGKAFVQGIANAPILASQTALSFWGGVDPASGEVIDRHHPLSGQRLQGKILALPGGRGSCSGSGVILEMIVNGKGPSAIVIARPDEIIILGVLIAQALFSISIPLIMLSDSDFKNLITKGYGAINGEQLSAAEQPLLTLPTLTSTIAASPSGQIALSEYDQRLLAGECGPAAQVAMQIIVQMAALSGAKTLHDITQVHIDGCIYTGNASLSFAQKLLQMGGQFTVPTTLNAISVDYRRWQKQGVDKPFGEAASALADTYLAMGAKPSFTCAPYLLESAPQQGDQIAWAESNAVIFANSVLGARTMKYPDFLDACIALTGRAPLAGAHLTEHRKATLKIVLTDAQQVDDLFYPLLGYKVGQLAGDRIPVLQGLAHLLPSRDDLKAFGAAFATTSSAPMFHITGVTPDAPTTAAVLASPPSVEVLELSCAALYQTWQSLNQVDGKQSDLISLGNPHFTLSEFKKLAQLCKGKQKMAAVEVYVTACRAIVSTAKERGYLRDIEQFGAKIITDTCWCMIEEPVIPLEAEVICTNSAKYAHYGPGITGCRFKLLSLAGCIQEASTEECATTLALWMGERQTSAVL